MATKKLSKRMKEALQAIKDSPHRFAFVEYYSGHGPEGGTVSGSCASIHGYRGNLLAVTLEALHSRGLLHREFKYRSSTAQCGWTSWSTGIAFTLPQD